MACMGGEVEEAKVTTQVAPQTNDLPFDQGTMVRFHRDAYHLHDQDQWALAEKEHWQKAKPCAEML